ncbi:MAG TPA: hypothetical protein PJ990_19900 [Saprospiraceae bacterium]|nr:hypothetical protein [Saprospiraceae bacterium]
MGFFNFFKNKPNQDDIQQSESNQIDESQREFIQDMTNNAERIVEAYNDALGGTLDFSVNSLYVLDELLEQFHQNKDEVDEEMLSDLIGQAGGYIFEVARRNYGGKYYWYEQMNQPILVTGQPKFEISIIAFDKVKMRLENGQEDNIPFYFKGYEERVIQGIEGDNALIN